MRNFVKVSLAILLMAVLAWASDPWKSKPYQDWNQKDVDKVLNSSPWVRTINVTPTWRPGGMMMNAPREGGMRPAGGGQPTMTGQPSGQPGPGNSEIPSDRGVGARMEGPRQVVFQARWVSSQTMREALARSQVLDGKMSQPNAEQFVNQAQPNYQIAVFGPDMTPFAKLDDATIAKESYLEMKESKTKVAPTSVQLVRAPDGRRVAAVTFTFPKTTNNGEPTVGPKEKRIELVCKLKATTLKFRFDPRKMENKKGRDL